MRILCLHGRGTNNKILEFQTGSLRYAIGEKCEFEFVEGLLPWDPDPAFVDLLPFGTQCFSYLDEQNPETLMLALQAFEEFLQDEEPFDAVLGFSQGATLAATFLAKKAKEKCVTPFFKCGFFFSCAGLIDIQRMKWQEVDATGYVIGIPTGHFFGSDDDFRPASLRLVQLCDPSSTEIFEHNRGHEIPTKSSAIFAIAERMKKVMQRACLE